MKVIPWPDRTLLPNPRRAALRSGQCEWARCLALVEGAGERRAEELTDSGP